MIKKLLGFVLVLAAFTSFGQQRPGSLRGTVYEAATGEPVPFANVVVKDEGGNVIRGVSADMDGKFNINPLNPGAYNVEVSFMGFATITLQGVQIQPNSPTLQDFNLKDDSETLDEVIIYEKPLISTTPVTTVTAKEIEQMAVRDITSIAAQTAGVYVADDGAAPNIRGARGNQTTYFIDGVKVRGELQLPQGAIQQQEVYTGGLPAQYGDAVGGVIATTTKGASPIYFGQAEILTSTPFDQYHYNLLALTAGGPLIKRKKDKKPLVGFLLAGEFQFENDPRPANVTQYRVEENLMNQLRQVPVRPSNQGQGVLYNSEFVTQEDLVEIPARLNAQQNNLRMNLNLTVNTGDNTSLTFGGRFVYVDGTNPNLVHSLFNYNNYLETVRTDWAAFARFQQRFVDRSDRDGESKSSLITNAFYSIQLDYTRNSITTQHPRHRDNIFAYGHVGTFDRVDALAYVYGQDTATGLNAWRGVSPAISDILFTPSQYNPELAAYTSFYYDAVATNPALGATNSFETIQQGNGLLNGTAPRSVYGGIWGNIGAVQGGYTNTMNSQFRITGQTTFDIKDHSLIVGFEYEQRFDRQFNVSAGPLWVQMRLLQNAHVTEFDLANPQLVFDENGVFQDTILYPRLFAADQTSAFSLRFRESIGLDREGTDFINIDGYDPSAFSLDMFAADELINLSGGRLVGYYGYDHTGALQSGRPTLNDFFFQRNEDGTLARPIGAFEPIYMSAFIQDQFVYNDLRFNVGVRVDRYDANQQVLRDEFLLYPAAQVQDLGAFGVDRSSIPGSMGDNYTVYVSDYGYLNDPNITPNIVGYREGRNFFDGAGRLVSNPKDIADAGGGNVRPLFFDDPDNFQLGPESFVDYRPQIVVMPRINFNFPISDEALFFAHYDVLAQRPDLALSRFDPIAMLEFEALQGLGNPISNPNLLPQRTTDYELGFTQVLTRRSSIKISGFYREMRDMMQVLAMTSAYPATYITYGNLDFSTVKGFVLEYDLRRTNNVSLFANYTLQFADGTGSGPNTSANLARTEQPNIRFILPLDFDSRHQFTARVDYRYGAGADYNGPVWGNMRVFENAGINFVLNANSGTPYTRRQFAYSSPTVAPAGVVPSVGQVNGSRLPWQVRADMRINKNFNFRLKDGGRKNTMEVYVQVLNVFNRQNVLNVYDFTGSPDDDGYIASPQAQQVIQQQVNAQSYMDLYQARVTNNPFNFTLPRRIRLGIMWTF